MPAGSWFVVALSVLFLAGCTDESPTAPGVTPGGPKFNGMAGNYRVFNAQFPDGSPAVTTFRVYTEHYGATGVMEECFLSGLPGSRELRCGRLHTTFLAGDRRCSSEFTDYPIPSDLDRVCWQLGFPNPAFLSPEFATSDFRVTAQPTVARGGETLPFVRWVVENTEDQCEEGLTSLSCTLRESTEFKVTAIYGFNFSGFLPPVAAEPTPNVVKAGSAIPVKFSLAGDQTLDILASGSPSSTAVACEPGDDAGTVTIEETASAGSSGLSYDAETDVYTYVWKTSRRWADTCRRLSVTLIDGTVHTALIAFKRK